MDRASTNRLDESTLTKGPLRRPNALRKSVGRGDIGERAFAEWLASRQAATEKTDRHAQLVAETLWPIVQEGRLGIRPGGDLPRRGRGRPSQGRRLRRSPGRDGRGVYGPLRFHLGDAAGERPNPRRWPRSRHPLR